jgi:hypothetical protein
MRRAKAIATALALSACTTSAASAQPVQDISFIGGCWEKHDGGNADFLRLLRDQKHPGGFIGDQSQVREGKSLYTSRWTFEPGGTGAMWESTTGMADSFSTYTPAPDLSAEDRVIPPGAQAAFFWDRPGDLYLKVMRQNDLLRISRHPAKGSLPRYAKVNAVIFEGRLSGCD